MYCKIFYVSKNVEINCLPFSRSGWEGKIGEDEQRVQTSSYKMNESWGCTVQRGGSS